MEDRGRSFEAVKIGMASVETGQERFHEDEHNQQPIPAFWRVNLTALSQKHNLYFVAVQTEVHVYEPRFPFQKLGGKPILTIVPQLSNGQAPGYISSRNPHYINNLIVGQLGEQEVLLLSTDSGNVTGYETTAIVNAIIRCAADNLTKTGLGSNADIRPFFAQWVVESAWGLSIHTKGRMIAVSANASWRGGIEVAGTWEERASVTVFAFALTTSTSDDESEENFISSSEMLDVDSEWNIWDQTSLGCGACFPSRHRNYKIVLAGRDGHPTNVPYVSFFNTQEDQAGGWILSTDVAENVKLWQIWSGTCIKTWEFRDYRVSGAAWLGVEERGWVAAALDRRAFQPVSGMTSLIGHHRAPQHYGYDGQGDSFDITNIVRHHVPSNAHRHPLNDSDSDSDSSADGDTAYLAEDLSDSGSVSDGVDTARAQGARSEFDAELLSGLTQSRQTAASSSEIQGTPQSADIDEYLDESSSEDDDFEVESNFSEDNASGEDVQDRATYSPESTTSISSYHTGNSSTTSALHCRSSPASKQLRYNNDVEMLSDMDKELSPTSEATLNLQHSRRYIPDVPFIYCSSSHLRLFDSANARSPHLFCARLLKQAISTTMEDQGIVQMDRLDMLEQIPELGIVIIATQFGRCAICSLTKRRSDGILGLRVDWILPTQKQERAGLRPHMPLHGIAISPVHKRSGDQNSDDFNVNVEHWTRNRVVNGVTTTFDKTTLSMSDANRNVDRDAGNKSRSDFSTAGAVKTSPATSTPNVKNYEWSKQKAPKSWKAIEGQQRYRLMMTYADMTVLTYEISRGVEREDIRAD